MPSILKGSSNLFQFVTLLTYIWKIPGSHLGRNIDDPEVIFVLLSTAGLMGSGDSVVIMTGLLAIIEA
jgi:hypothetical protein